MSWIAPVLSIVGLGMQALGQQQAGEAAQDAGNYNAQIAEQNATLTRDRTATEERRYRAGTRRQMGSIQSAYAASGVTMEGSAMDVVLDSALTAERDALAIRHSGEIEAAQFESEAELQRLYGAQAAAGGRMGAAATLLGGAGRLAGRYGPRPPSRGNIPTAAATGGTAGAGL